MFKKSQKLFYYDVYPKVLPINKSISVTIHALSCHVNFSIDESYEIRYVGVNDGMKDKGESAKYTVVEDGRKLIIDANFVKEQEYNVSIAKKNDNEYKIIVVVNVYAVENDLLAKRPLLGDFHVHTCRSDGKESPAYVAARYREEGFDFIPVTDHYKYTPSLEAIDAFKDLNIPFKIYTGEEVHTPNNDTHLINFGGEFSINELSTKNYVGSCERECDNNWLSEVTQIQNTLIDFDKSIDTFEYASSLLACRKIRQANGLAIFCHPHWRRNTRNVSDAYTVKFLSEGHADAFEVIGGQTVEENITQIELYNQLRIDGINIPIVGSSDSHGTTVTEQGAHATPFLEELTIVFVEENTKEHIINAVKSHYSIAVEQYIGQNYHFYGNYRLIQYSLFLYENFFPLKAEICREEGRLMRNYVAGFENSKEQLLAYTNNHYEIYDKYFSAIQVSTK